MRGKDPIIQNSVQISGITPAHAGKSVVSVDSHPQAGDHPRACGEKNSVDLIVTSVPGSPPRMRGKDGEGLHVTISGGITPAHAGKSIN
mgnify:CR=1 FL=1